MRSITSILRDIDTIEKSKYLNNNQKAAAIRDLQNELTKQVGQGALDLKQPEENGTPSKTK